MRTVKDIVVAANGKRRQVRALFDTGATINYLRPEIADEFPGHVTAPKPLKLGLGGKTHTLKELLPLTVRIEEYEMPAQVFYVADLKKFDAVIGAFFMEQWGVKLDPKGRKLGINRKHYELQEEY